MVKVKSDPIHGESCVSWVHFFKILAASNKLLEENVNLCLKTVCCVYKVGKQAYSWSWTGSQNKQNKFNNAAAEQHAFRQVHV